MPYLSTRLSRLGTKSHVQTSSIRRRIHAAVARRRLRARHHDGGGAGRRADVGRLHRGLPAAELFPRDFRRGRVQRRLPSALCRGGRRTASDERPHVFADDVFSWQMVVQIVLLVAALAFMPWIVRVLAPGFAAHPGQIDLATELSRITFPYLILTMIAIQLSAMLNAYRQVPRRRRVVDLPQSRDDRDAAAHSRLVSQRGLRRRDGRVARGDLQLSSSSGPRRAPACVCACLAALDAGGEEFSGRSARRRSVRPACRSRSFFDTLIASFLPRRSDGAVLCRPHQSIADGHARHCAWHGAAAGDVDAHRQGRREGRGRRAEPRAALGAVSDAAVRGGVLARAGNDHARRSSRMARSI